ncbi:Mature-T-Cell Proliferation I type [Trinorchestia longiramus]|nr:Mature-T-Cell Proliferation I type [Trinorchestia longiramus]
MDYEKIKGTNKDPCKPKACAIQRCLERTRYNVVVCQPYFDKLSECCLQFADRSDACGGEQQKPQGSS